MQDTRGNKNPLVGWITLGVIALLAVTVVFSSFSVIGSTDRGVKIRLGAIQTDQGVLPSGLVWKIPFIEDVRTISMLPQEIDVSIKVDDDGAITKDNQTIGMGLTVFYTYKPEGVVQILKDLSVEKVASLVQSGMVQDVKQVHGGYSIYDIAQNQAKLQQESMASLKQTMSAYPINVTELRIKNYDWGKEFDEQIKTTMSKAQQVLQAKQDLDRRTIELQKDVAESSAKKQQTVLDAEAAAQQVTIAATAEKDAARARAEAKTIEGEAIRKYNASIAQNLDVQLALKKLDIEATKAARWDGHNVPTNNYGPIPVQTNAGLAGVKVDDVSSQK